jgi:hypothetical protein
MSQINPDTGGPVAGSLRYGAYAPGADPDYTLTGPFRGAELVASEDFLITRISGGGVVAYTPHGSGAGGDFTPPSESMGPGSAPFKFTPSESGDTSVSVMNDGGQTDPPAIEYDSFKAPSLAGNPIVAADGISVTVPFDVTVYCSDAVGFTFAASGGAVTLAYDSGGGTDTLRFIASRAIQQGETVTASYDDTAGLCQAAYLFPLASFSGGAVTNDSTQTGGGLKAIFTSYWTLEGNSGVALIDRIVGGSGNNLTTRNTPGTAAGKITTDAIHFAAASSQSAGCAINNLTTDDATAYYVCAWVWLDSKPSEGTIYTNEYPGAILRYRSGPDRFEFFFGDTTLVTADTFGSPATGQWYFVEAWYDPAAGGTQNICVNAGAVDSSVLTGTVGAGSDVAVGTRGSYYWDGRINGLGVIVGGLPSSDNRAALWNGGAGVNPFA